MLKNAPIMKCELETKNCYKILPNQFITQISCQNFQWKGSNFVSGWLIDLKNFDFKKQNVLEFWKSLQRF